MKILKIIPQGFCHGVLRAIHQINHVLDENQYQKPLYMLGSLVHNRHVVQSFEERGIEVIHSIDSIQAGTIIITAHGLSVQKQKAIKEKGLNIIDATCDEVKKIQNLVQKKLQEGYTVLYYGKKNHAECQAIIESNPEVILIEKIEDINHLPTIQNKIFFTSQTTMSYFDLQDILNKLSLKYNNIEKGIDVCNATKHRQEAVLEQAPFCDLCLIIGDPSSHNTMKLKEICEEKAHTKAILIENIADLASVSLNHISILGITSGASTPKSLVDEVIQTIQKNYPPCEVITKVNM